MTNYEVIKIMSEEELGKLLSKIANQEIEIDNAICKKCKYKINNLCPIESDCIFNEDFVGAVWLRTEYDNEY